MFRKQVHYTADQTINIASGGSNTATAKVQNVTRGVVDEIIVDTAGTGYAVGDDVVLDNSNTDGVGAVAEVSVVGGGIAPESGSLSAYGMNANDHITIEETSQNFYNDTYLVDQNACSSPHVIFWLSKKKLKCLRLYISRQMKFMDL